MTRRHPLLLAASLVLVGACSGSSSSNEAGPSPSQSAPPSTARAIAPAVQVSGPVEGGNGQATAAVQDLTARGYTESEYFYGGTATSYVGDHQADGVWDAREEAQAEFRSRMIVRRPQDSAQFSGTVVVEWFNVTIGSDANPSWGYAAEEIMREGHAWVGVSAQAPGIRALVDGDAPRYGSLDHPGDKFSFDIFTQAGRALTSHDGAAPLGDVEPETLIAIGLSGSAAFLTAYIDGVQPLVEVFDGFLIHAPIQPAPIRTDLDAPTFVFVTESDLPVFASARQPDSDSVRTWEVAGAAHVDGWLLNQAGGGFASSCPHGLNQGPHHQTLRAALHHLVAWVRTGEPPPVGAPIELTTEPGSRRPTGIERDDQGNARGGIRTPLLDVPTSTLSSDPVPGSPPLCQGFGSTTPFDAATLARLYPDHDTYVEAFTASTEAAVEAGFILRPEADAMIAAAQTASVPS